MSVTAAATEIPFFLEIEKDTIEGVFSIIWSAMRAKFNFSLSTLGIMDFGELYSDKNGSGIFGTLIRNETQFSVVPMYATEKAVLILDYTPILSTAEWAIISGPPQIFLTEYFSSLRIFEKFLWKMIALVLFLYALCWTVITQCLKKKWFGLDFVKSFGKYLFSSVIVLVNQYHYVKSKRIYERLCWSSWAIACMLLSLSFTGLLLAKLAKKSDPFRYEALEDILQDPTMKLLLVDDTPPYNEIKTSDDPVTIKIWNKVNLEKTIKSFDDINYIESFYNLMRGKLAIIAPTRFILGGVTFACGDIVDINISKHPYSASMFTLYMRKDIGLEIRNRINYVSEQIAESHILEAKMNFLESMGRLCILSITPEISPLALKDLYFILLTYVFIMTCALCSFAMEVLLPPK